MMGQLGRSSASRNFHGQSSNFSVDGDYLQSSAFAMHDEALTLLTSLRLISLLAPSSVATHLDERNSNQSIVGYAAEIILLASGTHPGSKRRTPAI